MKKWINIIFFMIINGIAFSEERIVIPAINFGIKGAEGADSTATSDFRSLRISDHCSIPSARGHPRWSFARQSGQIMAAMAPL